MRPATGTLLSLVVGVIITMSIALVLRWDEVFALIGVQVVVRPAPVGHSASFLWFLLYGLIAFTIARSLSYLSLSLAGVAKTSPLIATDPLFATLLAITIGGETANLLMLMGTASVTGGLVLILSQR